MVSYIINTPREGSVERILNKPSKEVRGLERERAENTATLKTIGTR